MQAASRSAPRTTTLRWTPPRCRLRSRWVALAWQSERGLRSSGPRGGVTLSQPTPTCQHHRQRLHPLLSLPWLPPPPPHRLPPLQISLINLNDGTCAGMVHPGLKAMTVQSHPEASPGPHDSDVAFSQVHAGMHAWVPSCMASQPASCGALLVHVVSTLRSLPPP